MESIRGKDNLEKLGATAEKFDLDSFLDLCSRSQQRDYPELGITPGGPINHINVFDSEADARAAQPNIIDIGGSE